jgi:hypothetical protein
MNLYDPKEWNIHHHISSDMQSINNRTNNPLERFNRTLNESFSCPHPSLSGFIQVIMRISENYVNDVKSIKEKKKRMPSRQDGVTMYTIPQDYYSFIPPNNSINTKSHNKKRSQSISIHALLDHYKTLVLNSTHNDKIDGIVYRVYKIEIENFEGEDVIMCHRREVPLGNNPQKGPTLAEDRVSIEDVCEMAALPLHNTAVITGRTDLSENEDDDEYEMLINCV